MDFTVKTLLVFLFFLYALAAIKWYATAKKTGLEIKQIQCGGTEIQPAF